MGAFCLLSSNPRTMDISWLGLSVCTGDRSGSGSATAPAWDNCCSCAQREAEDNSKPWAEKQLRGVPFARSFAPALLASMSHPVQSRASCPPSYGLAPCSTLPDCIPL